MINAVGAAVLALLFVWFVPGLFVGAGIRVGEWFPGVIVFALFWCALSLRDIEAHLRTERKRRALSLDEPPAT